MTETERPYEAGTDPVALETLPRLKEIRESLQRRHEAATERLRQADADLEAAHERVDLERSIKQSLYTALRHVTVAVNSLEDKPDKPEEPEIGEGNG